TGSRVTSTPYRSTSPRAGVRCPATTSASARCPFPSTPAMPRISPCRSSSETSTIPRSAPSPGAATDRSSRTTSASAATSWSAWPSTSSSRSSATPATARASSPNMIRTISARSSSAGRERNAPGSIVPASRPWRRIEMRSPSVSASWSLCVMKTTAWPCSFSRSSTFASSATACGVSIDVGSSRIRTRDPRQSALTISTCCWCPSARSAARAPGSIATPSIRASSARRRRAPAASSRSRRVSPSMRFSSTVSAGISAECCGTVPMPRSSAVRGDEICVWAPSIRIVPASGRSRPERIPIRVDLPAPFSPSRQCTSPPRSARSTRSFASTPGNAFVIPRSSTIGVPLSFGALRVNEVCSKTRSPRWHRAHHRGRRAESLLDQLFHVPGLVRDRDLDLAGEDLPLRLRDRRPGGGGDVLRLQQRDTAVLQVEVVAVRPEGAAVHVLDRLLEGAREVPQHRRQEHVVLVDRRHVPDVADHPDLVADLRALDRLQVAEGGVVAHREEHVCALRDHARGDALAAGGVVVAGRADGREDDLRGLVDAPEAGREAAAHLVPVVVRGRDDDADLVRLRHLRGEDSREVRAFLARSRHVRDVALREVRRHVPRDHRHLVLLGQARGDRVVAARLRDDEVRAPVDQLLQDHVRLVVADVRDRLELSPG